MGSVTHPAPARRLVALPLLWTGLFAGPAIWSVQIMVGYALLAHACFPGSHPVATPTSGAAWWLALAVSIVAILVTLGALIVAIRSWKRMRAERAGREQTALEAGEGRTRFMALGGVLLSSLFLLGVILNSVALFIIPLCSVPV
jgi:hypothetical protein